MTVEFINEVIKNLDNMNIVDVKVFVISLANAYMDLNASFINKSGQLQKMIRDKFDTTKESIPRAIAKVKEKECEKKDNGGRIKESKNYSSLIIEAYKNDANIREYDGVPVDVIHLDDNEDSSLKEIPSEYTLKCTYIPGSYKYIIYHKHKYAAKDKTHIDGAINTATLNDPMKKNFLSTTSTVHLIIQKFLYGVPPYRLLKEFTESKIKLNYDMLINIVQKAGNKLKPLAEKLEEIACSTNDLMVIGIDETTISLVNPMTYLKNNEEVKRSKHYIYAIHTPLVEYYKFTGSRSAEWLKKALLDNEYEGYAITDDFSGYNSLDNNNLIKGVQICACHSRRRFYKAFATLPKKLQEDKNGAAYIACVLYDKIFELEKRALEMNSNERFEYRNSKEYQQAIDELHSHVLQIENPPKKSYLEDAKNYTLSNWDKLWTYRKNGNLKMTNQDTENAIKKVAMIRNSSLHFNNQKSGEKNCYLISIVQTAVKHNMDINRYLNYVLHYIDIEPLDNLLPWSKNLYAKTENYRC